MSKEEETAKEILEITMDKLTDMIKELMDSKEKGVKNEQRKMNLIIPKFSGKKEESFEEYLFKLKIWREVSEENEKTKLAQIIGGLAGEPLEVIMSLNEKEIWTKDGVEKIIHLSL